MKTRQPAQPMTWIPSTACLLALLLSACAGDDGDRGPAGPQGPAGPSGTSSGTAALDEGLVAEITSVSVAGDASLVVTFTLADGADHPVSLADLDGNPNFVVGYVDVDDETGHTRYQSFIVRDVAGAPYEYQGMTIQPALASATQATGESNGVFTEMESGVYTYKTNMKLPGGFDLRQTITVGCYLSREGRTWVANAVHSFVPSGGALTTHEITATANCNSCHDPLAIHGGLRREVGLCNVCHTDQTIDPETGENLDLGHMVHKIHKGEGLNNPYLVVGFRQSVHDYSHVVYPQDERNCETCHQNAADAENWRTRPKRLACQGCHDDVNFETGENHGDRIQQFDDFLCNRCHRATEAVEFDRSVPGTHTLPYESMANPQLTLTVTEVSSMMANLQPSVRFTVTNRNGPVDITTLNRVAIVFAGSTADYAQPIPANSFTIQGGGAAGTLTTNAVGDYTFAPDGYVIPANATGTWSVGMEARTENLPVGDNLQRFGANNPVVHVDLAAGTLGGGSPVARRTVVDKASCDGCHGDLRFHGELRSGIEYCVLCHNTWATDEARRPGVDAMVNPPESIDFKYLVHKIHRGSELAQPFTVYGFGNTPHDYTEVVYPGNVASCERCHEFETHLLPSRGAVPTVVNIGGTVVPQAGAIRPPVTSACTSCHDSPDALTHARLNSIVNSATDWAESCLVCHGEGSAYAVSEQHPR